MDFPDKNNLPLDLGEIVMGLSQLSVNEHKIVVEIVEEIISVATIQLDWVS